MMFAYSPCCGEVMQNSKKPYDLVGYFEFKTTTKDEKKIEYNSRMPIWKCPKCNGKWAIEKMVKTSEKN